VTLATAWAVPDIAAQATVPGVGAVADAERWIAGAAARREVGLGLDLVAGPLDGEVLCSAVLSTTFEQKRDQLRHVAELAGTAPARSQAI